MTVRFQYFINFVVLCAPLDVVVGQVRMVFGFSTRGSALPPELAQPLLYVQLFEVILRPQDDPAVMMHHVR